MLKGSRTRLVANARDSRLGGLLRLGDLGEQIVTFGGVACAAVATNVRLVFLGPQYDVFDGRHVNRFVMPEGVASPALGDYPQQKIVDAMQRDIAFYADREITLGEGETARERIADHARRRFSKSTGRDFSKLSTSEAVDLIQYQLFPNLGPWAGMATPLVYRFRPNGDNPEECIMEIMMLFGKAEDGSHPPVDRKSVV